MENLQPEELAKAYLKKIEICSKVIKSLFFAIMGVVLAFAVFAISAFATGMRTSNKLGMLIGCAVFLGVTVLLIATVVFVYLYAFVNLKKLKKLG